LLKVHNSPLTEILFWVFDPQLATDKALLFFGRDSPARYDPADPVLALAAGSAKASLRPIPFNNPKLQFKIHRPSPVCFEVANIKH
jgi:hypothetical protein